MIYFANLSSFELFVRNEAVLVEKKEKLYRLLCIYMETFMHSVSERKMLKTF